MSALQLAWRFIFARRRLATMLALVAVGGIALGVLVLTTVLAVMSGFETVLSQKLIAVGAAMTVTPPPAAPPWRALASRLEQAPGVSAAAPQLSGQALLLAHGRLAPVGVTGIVPAAETRATDLGRRLQSGSLGALVPGAHGLIVGKALAEALALAPGDPVTVLTARPGAGASGFAPALSHFRIAGVYRLGVYEVEKRAVYTDLADARELFPAAGRPDLILRLTRPLQANSVAARLRDRLGRGYTVSDWSERQADLFATIGLEKRMLFVVLAAVLAVAAFTVVATLIVAGLDRESDIAVLKTLGMTPRKISGIFLMQGLLLGVTGTGLGLGLGVLLAVNVNRLLGGLDRLFHTRLLPPSIYLISELPAQFRWQELAAAAGVAMALALVAAVYPAMRGARLAPAEALRYE